MKRVNIFMIAAFVAASAVFVSCTDDTDVEDPSVLVKATYGTQNNQTIVDGGEIVADLGTIVTFNITFNMGTNKLSAVHMKSTIGSKVFNVLDSTELDKGIFNSGAKSIAFNYVTNVGLEAEKLTFQTIDTKGLQSMSTVNINKPTPPAVNPEDVDDEGYAFVTQNITLLGGQNNATTGSFYSVQLGKVMTIGAATSQQGDVDFAYYYGSSNQATIAAPVNDQAQTISYGSTKMSSWSTKRTTNFFKVTGANGDKPEEWWNNNIDQAITDTHANQLAVGNVIIFKTQSGTKGAFVVLEQTGTQSGSIKLKLIEKKKVN